MYIGEATDEAMRHMTPVYRATFLRRLSRWIRKDHGCWLWVGSTNGKYAVVSVVDRGSGRLIKVHRALYIVKFGFPEPGLELDHTCRRKLCVNPRHLEPVTGAVNRQRAVHNPEALAARDKRQVLSLEEKKEVDEWFRQYKLRQNL